MATAVCDCQICNYRTPDLKSLISHLRAVHSKDDDFSFVCDIDGCGQHYAKCSSYVSHVYRKHRCYIINEDQNEDIHMDSSSGVPGSSTLQTAMNEIEFERIESHHDDDIDTGVDPFIMDQLLGLDVEQQQRMSALFLLGLKEGHCLSQTAVDDIVSSCQDMFMHYNLRIRVGVQEQLLKVGIDSNSVPEIESFLAASSDPFVGLHSTYMQEKFYREKLGCIVSSVTFLCMYSMCSLVPRRSPANV